MIPPQVGKTMDRLKFEYKFAGDPKRITEEALKAVGLECALVRPREVFDNLSAYDWFTLCQLLHIPADSISYGYGRHEHRTYIRRAWEAGELYLPRTQGLRQLLKEIRADRARDLRWRDDHYGFRLRWKSRLQDFKLELRLLPRRWTTEIRVRLRDFRAPQFRWEPRQLLERAS